MVVLLIISAHLIQFIEMGFGTNLKNGIDGNPFSIVRSIYADVKSCVRNIKTLSDFFSSDVCLMPREVISPFLFLLFINDIEVHLQQNSNARITLDQLSIYLLLFADDAVIFNETPEGL